MSATELAHLMGITPQAVGMRVKRTGMPRNPDGTFSLSAVWRWEMEHAEAKAESTRRNPAQERRDLADAEWRELRVAEKRGEFLRRAEVEKMFSGRVSEVKRGFLAIPKSVAHRVAGMSDPHEIEDLLLKRIAALCNQYARPINEKGS